MRKLTLTREHGLEKKMKDSLLTSKLMGKVAGDPFLRLQAFFVVARVVVSVGLIIFALI